MIFVSFSIFNLETNVFTSPENLVEIIQLIPSVDSYTLLLAVANITSFKGSMELGNTFKSPSVFTPAAVQLENPLF